MAKRWQWLLNKGVLLIEVKFPISFYNYNLQYCYYLGTLITGCFIEGGCLMEVEKYSLQQDNDKKITAISHV